LDIGSGRADLIAERLEKSGGLAIITDHHDPIEAKHKKLLHLNPEIYGYSGETDASGSTAAYLLMRTSCDLRDAAWLAVVGSAEIPGPLRSLNRLALEDAVKAGDVAVKGSGEGERYLITFLKKPWDKISSALTAIGSIGYYEGGPYEAVRSLKSRSIPEDLAKRLQELRKKKFAQALAMISRRGLRADRMVQWFHLGDMFKGLGSKTVGTLASMLSYRRVADQKKYLIGFMNFEPEIPGLGRIRGSWVKVSVRAPKPLAKLIQDKAMPAISDLTIRAAERVGGSADGHRFAASGLIPAGRESDFIKEFNRLIDELKPE
ncbi:MAG: DHH family phosphoesterase, partial [Thaumarchaeota archaeon]|nr:DHH family phosphoesterase [Nitrososphaerota archaeon]